MGENNTPTALKCCGIKNRSQACFFNKVHTYDKIVTPNQYACQKSFACCKYKVIHIKLKFAHEKVAGQLGLWKSSIFIGLQVMSNCK